MFDKLSSVVLSIEGMSCGHCQKRVQDVLNAVKGVKSAEVSLESGTARLSGKKLTTETLRQAVEVLGFAVTSIEME